MKKRLWDKGQELNEEIHAFTAGNDPVIDMEIVAYDVCASAAHAKMLHHVGLLSLRDLKALLSSLKVIHKEIVSGSFFIPHELEDCHTAIESRLVKISGDVGKRIHTGRSRNDQIMVAMRLYLRDVIIDTGLRISALANVLGTLSEGWAHIAFPGYTHMQPAMPTTLGTWINSYAQYSLSLLEDGLRALEAINVNPLGVASGFGVPITLDREFTTNLLGFDRTQQNPIFVQSTRGREEVKVLHWLSDVSTLLERIGTDLCLFMTKEYAFFSLPVAFTTGSSIMPQKKNPDVVELLRARSARTKGARFELENVIAKLPSSYHRDYQLTKEPVFRAVENVNECLGISKLVFDSLLLDEDRIAGTLIPELYATHDVYRRVADGVEFRDAYLETAEEIESGTLDVTGFQDDLLGVSLEELSSCNAQIQILEERYIEKKETYGYIFDSIFE
jgi:argininosuccinate lyase